MWCEVVLGGWWNAIYTHTRVLRDKDSVHDTVMSGVISCCQLTALISTPVLNLKLFNCLVRWKGKGTGYWLHTSGRELNVVATKRGIDSSKSSRFHLLWSMKCLVLQRISRKLAINQDEGIRDAAVFTPVICPVEVGVASSHCRTLPHYRVVQWLYRVNLSNLIRCFLLA